MHISYFCDIPKAVTVKISVEHLKLLNLLVEMFPSPTYKVSKYPTKCLMPEVSKNLQRGLADNTGMAFLSEIQLRQIG